MTYQLFAEQPSNQNYFQVSSNSLSLNIALESIFHDQPLKLKYNYNKTKFFKK